MPAKQGMVKVDKIKIRKASPTKETTQIDTTEQCYNDVIRPEYDIVSQIDLYIINSTAKKCIDMVAGNVVSNGFVITSDDGKSNDEAKRLKEMFDKMNPDKPFMNVISDWVVDFKCTGNGAIEVSRGVDGKPDKIYNVPIATIQYLKGTKEFSTGQRFVQTDFSTSKKVYFNKYTPSQEDRNEANGYYVPINNQAKTNEIIWLKSPNPKSKWYGVSASLTVLNKYLSTKYAEEFNVNEFENGMLAKFMITVKNGHISQDSLDELALYLQEITSGNNWSTVPVVSIKGNGADIKVEKLSSDVKDGSFLELMRFNRQEIYVAFGVPPVMLGISENSYRATATEEERKFYQAEIQPIQKHIEYIFNRMIKEDFGMPNLSFEFVRQKFNDQEKVNNVAESGQKSGRYSINEARVMVGEEPIDDEGANERFIYMSNGTLINVKDLKNLTSDAAIEQQGKAQGQSVVENLLNIRDNLKERIDAKASMNGTNDKDNTHNIEYPES